jgi:nitrite reductase (NADH) large subunit
VKVVVVGNGVAGTLAAKTLRELDQDVEIEIIGEEGYPYYPRPNLIEYLAGRLPYEKLFAFPDGWADKLRIGLRLGEKAVRISPEEKTVETAAGSSHPYDALLLATGARAALPPIPGIDRKGIFVLRTLDDAQALIDHLRDSRRVAILGGGLLGLEIARAIRNRGAEVEVVEFFDRLLPRQLDPAAAAILKAQFEAGGISIRLKAFAKEVLGQDEMSGLRFETGSDLEADTLVVAAGIKPEVALAAEAGLRVGKGVYVDDRLQSSAPGIFAAGDAAEHRGRIYGIIPAAFEQARVAAYNILAQDKPYGGTLPSNTLKVAGLFLTSVGEIDTEEAGCEALVRSAPEAGLYKKIVLCKGRVIGAIWMGTKKGAPEINRLVAARKNIEPLRDELLQDDFDFSEIL